METETVQERQILGNILIVKVLLQAFVDEYDVPEQHINYEGLMAFVDVVELNESKAHHDHDYFEEVRDCIHTYNERGLL